MAAPLDRGDRLAVAACYGIGALCAVVTLLVFLYGGGR